MLTFVLLNAVTRKVIGYFVSLLSLLLGRLVGKSNYFIT
jgi:hypothetical protein